MFISKTGKGYIKKNEFIDRMAEKGGVTKCSCRKYVDLFLETFFELLLEGYAVRFYRLFKAEVVTQKKKYGRDFHNGGFVEIPEHKKIKFTFFDSINNRLDEET